MAADRPQTPAASFPIVSATLTRPPATVMRSAARWSAETPARSRWDGAASRCDEVQCACECLWVVVWPPLGVAAAANIGRPRRRRGDRRPRAAAAPRRPSASRIGREISLLAPRPRKPRSEPDRARNSPRRIEIASEFIGAKAFASAPAPCELWVRSGDTVARDSLHELADAAGGADRAVARRLRGRRGRRGDRGSTCRWPAPPQKSSGRGIWQALEGLRRGEK